MEWQVATPVAVGGGYGYVYQYCVVRLGCIACGQGRPNVPVPYILGPGGEAKANAKSRRATSWVVAKPAA